MLTREEYEKTYIRMMDSVRKKDFKGKNGCVGVDCNDCPIVRICHAGRSMVFNVFNFIEAIEKWGKEHPVTTYANKYKEVFGIDVTNYCPLDLLGLSSEEECERNACADCKEKYWNSEYVAPKTGTVTSKTELLNG